MVKLYVWQTPRGAWLAQCPDLELGGAGRTRREAIHEAHAEADYEVQMIFADEVEIVDGRPPAKEET